MSQKSPKKWVDRLGYWCLQVILFFHLWNKSFPLLPIQFFFGLDQSIWSEIIKTNANHSPETHATLYLWIYFGYTPNSLGKIQPWYQYVKAQWMPWGKIWYPAKYVFFWQRILSYKVSMCIASIPVLYSFLGWFRAGAWNYYGISLSTCSLACVWQKPNPEIFRCQP